MERWNSKKEKGGEDNVKKDRCGKEKKKVM